MPEGPGAESLDVLLRARAISSMVTGSRGRGGNEGGSSGWVISMWGCEEGWKRAWKAKAISAGSWDKPEAQRMAGMIHCCQPLRAHTAFHRSAGSTDVRRAS